MAGRRTIFAGGHIEWRDNQIRIMLAGPEGETSQEIQRRARAVQKRAQYKAPFRTGTLRHSISVNTRYPSEGAVADITADAPYSMMVEFGRRRIDMEKGRYLHWEGKTGDVFTASAEAVHEVPFMRDALDEAGD